LANGRDARYETEGWAREQPVTVVESCDRTGFRYAEEANGEEQCAQTENDGEATTQTVSCARRSRIRD
jgi:hypothetical protein